MNDKVGLTSATLENAANRIEEAANEIDAAIMRIDNIISDFRLLGNCYDPSIHCQSAWQM